jgi:hypothetical protein
MVKKSEPAVAIDPIKPRRAPAKKAAPTSAGTAAAIATAADSETQQAPTYQEVLDEALAETFPASDPIAPSAASHTAQPVFAGKDEKDWKLQPGSEVTGAASTKRAASSTPEPFHFPTSDDHHRGAKQTGPLSRDDRVRRAAYLRAEARGFAPGNDVEDWLAAEADVDRQTDQD